MSTNNYATHVAKYVTYFMEKTIPYLDARLKDETVQAAGFVALPYSVFMSPYATPVTSSSSQQSPPVLSSASISDDVDAEGSRVLMFLVDVIAKPPNNGQSECALVIINRKIKEKYGDEFAVIPHKMYGIVNGQFILDVVWDQVKYGMAYIRHYSRPPMATQSTKPISSSSDRRSRRKPVFDRDEFKRSVLRLSFETMAKDPSVAKAMERAIAAGPESVVMDYFIPKYQRQYVETKKGSKRYNRKLLTPHEKTFYVLKDGTAKQNKFTPSYALMFRGYYDHKEEMFYVKGHLPNDETMLDVLRRTFSKQLREGGLDLTIEEPDDREDYSNNAGCQYFLKVVDATAAASDEKDGST